MKNTDKFKDRLADSMILIGMALAAFFFLFKALLQFFLSGDTDFISQLMGRNISDFYDRLTVVVLFIFFGSHAQFSIRQRRKAELALRKSEEKYRSILESIEEGYYEIDKDFCVRFFNESFLYIFGSSRKDLLNLDIRQYMTEDSAAVFTKVLGEVGRTGKSVNTLECDLTIHDGYRRIVEISASAIIDANQKSTGFRGIVRDITEKKMLERQVLESLEDVKEARAGVILGLAKLAEYRDKDTGRHLERIREYAKLLAGEIAKKDQYREYITPEYIEDLYNSSILHDIGKVGIADAILLKPGRLTPDEYEIIKNHSILGGKTLSAVYDQIKGNSFLTIGMEIAYHHHEKWDGSGYPSGLKGKEIPLSARIVSIADVYDALVSKRCYKEAYTHEKSRDIIVSKKGLAFEPMLVDTFLVQEQEFKRIHIEMREDD